MACLGALAYELDLSRARITRQVRVSWPGDAWGSVIAEPEALPLETESMSLVVLPLALSYSGDPHQALREVQRILRPGGYLALIEYNPASLWGLRHWWGRRQHKGSIWQARPISSYRIRDWLELLRLEVMEQGRLGPWIPRTRRSPRTVASWLAAEWSDTAFGALQVYWIQKQVPAMTPIRQHWLTTALGVRPGETASQGRESTSTFHARPSGDKAQ